MSDALRNQLQAALGAHRAGRIDVAKDLYRQLYAQHPGVFDVVHLLGLAEFQSGALERGATLLGEALAINPNSAAAHNNLGNVRKAQGRLSEAAQSFGRALALKPDYPEALVNRGSAELALGNAAKALADYDAALRLVSGSAEARFGRGLALKELGRLADSLQAFESVLALRPQDAEALSNKGSVLLDLGRPGEAAVVLQAAARLRPGAAGIHFNLGNAEMSAGRAAEALASYDRAISLRPDHAEAHANRGLVLKELGRTDEALAAFERAVSLKPDYAEAHGNRANVLAELGRTEEAVTGYGRAISLKPDQAETHCNRGTALTEMNRLAEALADFDRAISLKPDYAGAHGNRGNVLAQRGQLQDAIASFDEAIRLRPDYAEAHANRGHALKEQKRLEEALASYDEAFRLKPEIEFLAGSRLHTRLKICDWTGLADGLAQVEAALRQGSKVVDPWVGLSLFGDPALQLAAAQAYAASKLPPAEIPRPSPSGKIRVGYYSSDFGDHPVSFLTAQLFEAHDRAQFELHAFSYGPPRKGAMRERIAATFGGIHDLHQKTDVEGVALARQLGIDIAVNLNGYTDNQRTGLFRRRSAPIQVNYLGYPGTMGVPFMDYLIADRVLVPAAERPFYAEKIVRLSGSFQANDARRRISDRVFSRAECSLPEHGFVFCSFNNTYKITPDVFGAWMRILLRVPGSVLWLYAENDVAVPNLRCEAAARGVDPARLVFAARVPPADYLARFRLADLFLDTLPYNAGTTASDALWAGLPVLTCQGRALVSRMAASLLAALDLESLVTSDLQTYEDLAVALAQEPSRLQGVRDTLARTRLSSSLFDGQAFARSIEAAYRRMAERFRSGLPPEDISLP